MAVGDLANPVLHSYVAVGKEGTFATYNTCTTAVEALSCTFKVDVEKIKVDAMTMGHRGYAKRVALGKEIKGTLEQYLHPIESLLLVANAMGGQVSSTAQTNSTLHSISAGNFQNSIASLSFNVRKGLAGGLGGPASGMTWQYQGGRCGTMKITGEIGQPVKVTYDFIFQDATQVSNDVAGNLSLSSVQPFTFVGGSYLYGASEGALSAERISHFELTINNGLKSDKDARALGTNTIVILPGMRREVTLKTTQLFDTTTVWNRFIQATEGAIELNFSGAAVVAATTASEYHMRARFRLPRVVQANGDAELKSSGDLLTAELEWDVLVDTPNTTTGREIGLTWINSTASV